MDAADIGKDYSLNPQSLAGLTLLQTIPAARGRISYVIQAQSAAGILVVFEGQDGDGVYGTATIIALNGPSSGVQGGSITMSGMRHTGRIRIYSSDANAGFAARVW